MPYILHKRLFCVFVLIVFISMSLYIKQKMKVVAVDKKTYGKFHTGDSYIVLHVSEGIPAQQ